MKSVRVDSHTHLIAFDSDIYEFDEKYFYLQMRGEVIEWTKHPALKWSIGKDVKSVEVWLSAFYEVQNKVREVKPVKPYVKEEPKGTWVEMDKGNGFYCYRLYK